MKELDIDGKRFNELWLEANGIRMHVVTGGSGWPLILLHGWPGYWKDWEKTMASLSEEFKVVVPDLRGFGLSDKPESPDDYTLKHYADDLESLICSFGIDRVVIAGYDLGSVLASYFAFHKRERVSGLVLLNPSYPGLGRRRLEEKYAPESWYQYFHLLDLAEKLVGYNRETTKIYLMHFYKHWSYKADAFSQEDIEDYVDVYYRFGLRGGFNWYRARFRTRYGDWLGGRVQVPTMILWSDRDPVFPLEWSNQVKEYFPNSELIIINECGHFIPREKPDEFVYYVKEFFHRRLRVSV